MKKAAIPEISNLMPLNEWLIKNEPMKNKLAWRERLAKLFGMTRQNVYNLSKKDDWFVSLHNDQITLIQIRSNFQSKLLLT